MQKLGADLLSFDGKDYTVVADYYSTWLEIVRLHTTTAAEVISKLQHIFVTHGVPDTVIRDNGPQFQCKEVRHFAHEFDFQHQTCSQAFPQANGLAESGVKIAKTILRQAPPVVALLNYRAKPHSSTGASPAQVLMGRQLKTKLRVLPDNLTKELRSNEDLRQADQKTKDSSRQNLDRWRGAWPLTPLKPRDWVLVKADEESVWKKEGKVVAADSENCTYLVNSSAGVLRLNRKHLQKLPSPRRVVTDSPNSSISSTSDS